MAKQCALCELPARMLCESDRASLCWECDARVHGANFLVARHSRSLLCRSCQSPTPWRASGARLGPTFSLCELCLGAGDGTDRGSGMTEKGERGGGRIPGRDGEDEDGEEEQDEQDEDEGDEGENEEEDEEDGDNQVVPLAMEVQTTTPPASCSSSEESSSRGRITFCPASLKQTRENGDLSSSQDDAGRPPPQGFYRRPFPPSSVAASTSGRRMPMEEPSPPSARSGPSTTAGATRRPPAQPG